MKLLAKNKMSPIKVAPGDNVVVQHSRVFQDVITGEVQKVTNTVAKIDIKKADTFDTAFIMELESGDLGFEAGYIGGIAR